MLVLSSLPDRESSPSGNRTGDPACDKLNRGPYEPVRGSVRCLHLESIPRYVIERWMELVKGFDGRVWFIDGLEGVNDQKMQRYDYTINTIHTIPHYIHTIHAYTYQAHPLPLVNSPVLSVVKTPQQRELT